MDVTEAQAQLIKLDLRLGKGIGAAKERAKLEKILGAPDKPPKIKLSRQKRAKKSRMVI